MKSSQLASWLAQSTFQGAMASSAWRFQKALKQPEMAQQRIFTQIMQLVSKTQQTQEIKEFDQIRSISDFQQIVPIRNYQDFQPWIEKIKKGQTSVLTQEPVLRFEKTGGSTGVAKYIPQTTSLLTAFQQALFPWLFNLYQQRPKMKKGPSYWSISPIGQKQEKTQGGISVGVVDDSSYFATPFRSLLSHIFAVPNAVAYFPDVESCRYVTLRSLLNTPDLSFISVWNPSFLTLLFEYLQQHFDLFLNDIANGTCSVPELKSRTPEQRTQIQKLVNLFKFRQQPLRAHFLNKIPMNSAAVLIPTLWPNLQLISCWIDAQSARAIPALQEYVQNVEIQGKGLLSTEGVVTIPLFGAPAPVLAIRSHFYEFLEEKTNISRLAHELNGQQCYEVVLSTQGGLLRYRTGDRVRVEGFYQNTPCFRFLGKNSLVSDLVGEKIHITYVEDILAQVFPENEKSKNFPRFMMLAPEWAKIPYYVLFLEIEKTKEELNSLGNKVEKLLEDSYHYGYARKLGQLGPLQVITVSQGIAHYEQGCIRRGQRAGDIKPVALHRDTGWIQDFLAPLK